MDYGLVEFWIEDEQFMLTKTCTIYIPNGIKHCPHWSDLDLVARKLTRTLAACAFFQGY
jgi:hypothetical protein